MSIPVPLSGGGARCTAEECTASTKRETENGIAPADRFYTADETTVSTAVVCCPVALLVRAARQ